MSKRILEELCAEKCSVKNSEYEAVLNTESK
jgi:hypothetical protein